MFKNLLKHFNRNTSNKNAELENQSFELKSKAMEGILGKEHDNVMHAIVPYDLGGALDLYYYPGFMNGTAVATKELVDFEFKGPKNDIYDSYEFVMCTKNMIDLDSLKDKDPNPGTFASDHKIINSILNLFQLFDCFVL